MVLAFVTGAVASGFTAAGLSALSVAIATYAAERIAHRRTLDRMRSTGEPWAYRES